MVEVLRDCNKSRLFAVNNFQKTSWTKVSELRVVLGVEMGGASLVTVSLADEENGLARHVLKPLTH